jgi:hypothetical protein
MRPPGADAFRPAAAPVGPPLSRDEQLSSLVEVRRERVRSESPRPMLARGSKGPAVAELQQRLEASGFSPGPIDGDFGPRTDRAVRAFQNARGLVVDGIVGPNTWGALEGAVEPPPAPPPGPPVTEIPPRPAGAMSGSQFLQSTQGLSRPQREEAILREILSGNVPEYLRSFREVNVSRVLSDGREHTATLRVLPDYLAIGSSEDFVRIPMGGPTGQRIADAFGCVLPTTRIVDEVWKQADLRLPPRPMTPGPQMMSNDYYRRHNQTIEAQRAGRPLGELVAGTKKDVVLSNGYAGHPGRVGIYGWHQPDGRPIQGLNFSHEATYADYSHGIRLVHGTMLVDGIERPVAQVLADPVLSELISSEGPIRSPRLPL